MSSVFQVEIEQATRVWIVNRPDVRNAIDDEVVTGLEQAVRDVEQDRSVRAVVLTGAGDLAFIAGADLKRLRQLDPAQRVRLDQRMHAVLARVAELPIPVIGALNGMVLGGGCEIALACDMRVGEPHSSFTFKHAAMGVTPGWGGLSRLAACVGRSTAARLLFTAQPLPAEDALRTGLLDELVPCGQGRTRALAIARSVEQVSPSAVADLKRLLTISYAAGDAKDAHDEERRTFLARAASPDHVEALAAFAEKRAARFGPR
jgi:enoyl-CoA hydratase